MPKRSRIDVPLRCACGQVRGAAAGVSVTSGIRLICYCADCQTFAAFLGRRDITDANGGTDLFQTAPARVRIEQDGDALQCVRLFDKGMYRWFCGHCKTPVANTVSPRLPFVALIHSFMDHASAGTTRDELLGAPVGLVQTQFAVGENRPRQRGTLRVIVGAARRIVTWRLTGAGSPSPLFDDETGTPRVEPRVLTAEERQAFKATAAAGG